MQYEHKLKPPLTKVGMNTTQDTIAIQSLKQTQRQECTY